ncbi:uncharacterized protein LOC130430308 isoform X2 [Triplophysa dalaica]|uniref:uncharacterized protein LOC130430308 isoform X2 n=1 Tax=Triplophysa dalaica TaxID=1582913 RepID=UPI0024DF3ED5|nr:uncharacterized protein LOC130430308 isoform X2 [Triplophysa dalaica]
MFFSQHFDSFSKVSTINIFIFLFLSLVFHGVGLDPDEVKSVSVTEGENVTIPTDVVKQKDDKIKWHHRAEHYTGAKVQENGFGIISPDGKKWKMNNQTGDLTITNTTTEDSGFYQLKIRRNDINTYKYFNVTVYTHLPDPFTTTYCLPRSSSSERCVVLCSVMNVSHDVSVSWYKGKSLLSSISVSDLNIRLSLPLEVEYQDTNTYRCVLDHLKRNQTQHVNITHVCQPCSDSYNLTFIVSINLVIWIICIVIILVYTRKRDIKVCRRFSHTKVALGDEESNSKSSSMFEDAEDQKCLNGTAEKL